jgi:hypothetical protein
MSATSARALRNNNCQLLLSPRAGSVARKMPRQRTMNSRNGRNEDRGNVSACIPTSLITRPLVLVSKTKEAHSNFKSGGSDLDSDGLLAFVTKTVADYAKNSYSGNSPAIAAYSPVCLFARDYEAPERKRLTSFFETWTQR